MKKSFVRFIGLMIATLMVVTMIPVTAFADHTAEGAPNVFSVFTTDEGDYLQTEFLLVDTLAKDGQTYYGLMLRRGINSYYGDSIKIPGVLNLDLVPDDSKASTETVSYQKFVLRTIVSENGANKGVNGDDMNTLVDKIYPDEMKPYIATLEHTITNHNNVNYNIVDNITIPSPEMVINNLDYLHIADNGAAWVGAWATGKNANYAPTYKWINGMGSDGAKHYGELGSQYDYYSVLPVVYVTADFFENVKIDTTKEVGSDIKSLLAGKYYQKELAHLGYTAEDFEILTVPLHPEVLTPDWSPDYVKVADGDLELLYNGETTIGADGKTYVSFTVAKDYQTSADTMGAFFGTTETLSDGTVNPDTMLYGQFSFCTPHPITPKESFDIIKDSLPQKIQDNLYLNTWTNTGSTYWLGVRGGESVAKSISYITLPSGDNMIKHGAYLKAQMDDNANPYYGGLVTYTGALVRDPNVYGAKLYDPEDGTVKNSGSSAPYCYGSIFPTFYLAVDTFKEVKMDVETMSDNVKAIFTANFVRSDLEGIYTEEELDEIGVESFTVESKPEAISGSTFVADGKTFYYLDNTIDYNGKKYFRIFDKIDWTPWNGDAFYPITERAEGGVYVGLKQGSLTGTDITSQPTNLSVFGDYIISEDYEWSYGKALYNGADIPVYLKGSINVPTLADYNYVINEGVSFQIQGQVRITSDFFVWNGNTTRYAFNGNTPGNGFLTYVEDGNYWKGQYTAGYNYVTYVSEDYFVENELDLDTTGEVVIDVIKANFTREELAAGGWNDATLNKLFDSSYEGMGLGLVAYKTGPAEVAVVINNNNPVASTGSKAIVVAAYSKAGLENAAVIPVSGTIPANAYTSKLTASLNVADGVEITEIKVMLWDSIENMKPLADIVCVN